MQPASTSAPDRRHFKAIVDDGKPILIKDAVRHWPAITRWSLDHVADVAGARRVPVEFYPEGNYYTGWLSFETTLKRYLELAVQAADETPGPRYYLAEVRIDERLPELMQDIELPGFIDPALLEYSGLFLGRDTITGLHYHATDQALLCQIRGTKHLLLYPPQDFRHLYFEPWYSHRFNFSRIDFGRLDLARFPELRRATPLVCTLHPGDACFIPIHWGHVVEGEGTNASVTFFWRAQRRHWAAHPVSAHALAGHRFRAWVTRPLARRLSDWFRYRVAID